VSATTHGAEPVLPRDAGRDRYGLLLGAVLLVFALQGIASPGPWGTFFVTFLLGVTLIFALWVAELRREVMLTAILAVVIISVASLIEASSGTLHEGPQRLANALLVVFAPPAVIVGVVRNLRARQRVTVVAVLGVISVYILVGMLFAQIYGALDHLGEAPFFDQGGPATIARCLYFSFTTLTTTGYGDLTARTNLGHTLSVTEALLGQIYLVTVVSLLVGNLRRDPGRRPPQST
jgi:hypothetical protein